MKLTDTFKTAIIGLKTNKTRSALTMLGIVIGIAAVITMTSIGAGAQNLILSRVASMGSNNIFIEPGPRSERMEKGGMMQAMMEEADITSLKREDAIAVANHPLVEMAAPFTMGVGRIVYLDVDKKSSYSGITPEGQKINENNVILGRDINEDDVKSMAKVVVLGFTLREDLFGDEDPIGKIIRIQKTNFRVIGVMEEQGVQMFQNMDTYAFIPITTTQKLLLGTDHVKWIIAKAWDEDRIDEIVSDLRLLLRERHNIYNPSGDLAKDDFKIMTQKETADILTSVTGVLTMFLSSVAGIALVVGGIGIMNIMLVSVNERTREIGLRKAVGARKKDILNQFLMEAVTLTFLGGVIGILLGLTFSYLGGVILGNMLDLKWSAPLSLDSILLSAGVAIVIGLIFGIYPARKAAELSPIEALRYE